LSKPTAALDIDTVEKNLLEELYPDRQFLKQLAEEPTMMEAYNGEVGELILEGIAYLDQRIEFWRNRNPLGLHESAGDSLKKEIGTRKWQSLPSVSSG
jgi:hypothetical protein